MTLIEKAKLKLGSFHAVAEYLEISDAYVSYIRSGKRHLQPIQAAKLAELVGERWTDHVLPTLAAMENKPADRDFWLGKIAALRSVAAAVVLAVAATIGLVNDPDPAFS